MSAPSALDPAAIERELREMWRAASAEAQGKPLVRAALVNCVLLAPASATPLAETVARVSAAVPCRALVVERAPASPAQPALEAWTSMHCRAEAGGEQVCCEQVTLRVRPDALEGLPAALLALLLPDLPTVLVVPAGATLEAHGLDRLLPHVDRLVVDSAGFDDAEGDLARLAALRSRGVEVADLNWGRLDCWRELFAAFFDAAPFDASLRELAAMEVVYAPAARAQALLLAGWLVSRLGWRIARASRERIIATAGRDAVEIAIRLASAPAPGLRPGLRRFVARTGSGIAFVVEPDTAHPTVLVGRVEGVAGPTPRRLEDRGLDTDAELVQVLHRSHRNPAYVEALDAAARIAAAPA